MEVADRARSLWLKDQFVESWYVPVHEPGLSVDKGCIIVDGLSGTSRTVIVVYFGRGGQSLRLALERTAVWVASEAPHMKSAVPPPTTSNAKHCVYKLSPAHDPKDYGRCVPNHVYETRAESKHID